LYGATTHVVRADATRRRPQYIHSSIQQASNHSKAKQSKAQHSTAQHNTADMGQSAGQLHSLHSPGCPRRRQLATGPLHRHFQTADAKSGRSERPRLKPHPHVSDRHCFSDTSIHIQQDQLHLARSPLGGPGGRILGSFSKRFDMRQKISRGGPTEGFSLVLLQWPKRAPIRLAHD
jgi:hypothetical protein